MSQKQPTPPSRGNKPAKRAKTPAVVDPIAKEQQEAVAAINWQWRKFALAIMNGRQMYQAYNDAYEIGDVEKDQQAYQVAAASATRLLKNVKFRKYWRELLEEQGFNDDVVDSQMLTLITDPATPHMVRRAAIRDYNELKGRIIKKIAPTDDKGNSLFDEAEFTMKVVRRGNGSKRATSNSV